MTIAYNANYIETLPFSDTCAQITCVSGTDITYTVPGTDINKYQVYFEYASEANVYIGLNVVPNIPNSNTVLTQRFVEYKPVKRYVQGGDVIHFLTPDDTVYMGISLRQLQG